MTNQLIQDPKKLKLTQIPIQHIESKIDIISLDTEDILDVFRKMKFARGLKILLELQSEYDKIINVSDTKETLINTNRIKQLATDIYNQGISLLSQVKTIAVVNTENLTKEIEELSEELATCQKETLRVLIEQRLEINKRNLTTAKKSKDRVDELLCEVELCTDSIREITLTLPELVEHKPKDEFDKILLELNARIEFAQRVKDEYVKQGL